MCCVMCRGCLWRILPRDLLIASNKPRLLANIATLLKNLDNAVKLARETDSASPLAALADQLMRLHATRGHGQADLSSVIGLFVRRDA